MWALRLASPALLLLSPARAEADAAGLLRGAPCLAGEAGPGRHLAAAQVSPWPFPPPPPPLPTAAALPGAEPPTPGLPTAGGHYWPEAAVAPPFGHALPQSKPHAGLALVTSGLAGRERAATAEGGVQDLIPALTWDIWRRRLPIVFVFFAVVLVVIWMYGYQRYYEHKYKGYATEMKSEGRRLDADMLLVKILNLVSARQVEDYQFNGISRKKCKIAVEFTNLSASIAVPLGWFPIGWGEREGAQKLKGLPLHWRVERKPILTGVTGQLRPSRMTAIMGPSGAGKTTFLNVLCGKVEKDGGEVRAAGGRDIQSLRLVTGFVPQDDVVHEGMRVRENIMFSAELRNKRGTSRKKLNQITADVLRVLQLDHIQNEIVGNRTTGGGLSGGQRKRVNIGLELAACPTLLFLDEPTSGLDSSSSLKIVHQLKKMAQLGMTIAMVIHQPRYSLFRQIDDVLLLGKGGRTVYIGPTQAAEHYFEAIGFKKPAHDNPADWMMDVISGQLEAQNPRMPNARLPDLLFTQWEAKASILSLPTGLRAEALEGAEPDRGGFESRRLTSHQETISPPHKKTPPPPPPPPPPHTPTR